MAARDDAPGSNRRTFLAQAIGACVAFLAALIGIPAIGAAVGPAFRSSEGDWTDLGKADSYPEGVPTAATFTTLRRDGWVETEATRAVWVVRGPAAQAAESGFVVFNGRCTHLGCAYHWQSDLAKFTCPCHSGVYGVDGSVVSGPPPRPLDAMPTRVVAGVLQVSYVDFRLGVGEKVPA